MSQELHKLLGSFVDESARSVLQKSGGGEAVQIFATCRLLIVLRKSMARMWIPAVCRVKRVTATAVSVLFETFLLEATALELIVHPQCFSWPFWTKKESRAKRLQVISPANTSCISREPNLGNSLRQKFDTIVYIYAKR